MSAFATVISGLEQSKTDRDRIRALGRNHELWSILMKALAADANKLPDALKSQLVGLAAWSMRYSTLAILHNLPLEPLITVNRNIVDGLEAQIRAVPATAHDAMPAGMSV